MRITQYQFGSQSTQLVGEIEAGFKHFFMEKKLPAALGSQHDKSAQQVGRKTRPRFIAQFLDGGIWPVIIRYYSITNFVNLNFLTKLREGREDFFIVLR